MREITESEFDDAVASNKIVIVDFYATWCGPCRMMMPVLEELDNTLDDVTIVKVNADIEQNLLAKNGVRSLPTFKFYKDGQVVDDKILLGAHSKEDFMEIINNLREN